MGMLVLFAPLVLIVLAVVFRKWWLVVPAILSLGWFWMAGAFIIAFGALHPAAYTLTWTMTLVGVALLLLRLKLRWRWLVWVGLALVLAFPLTLGGLSFCDWWTKGRFAKLENRVDWDEFEPFAPTNRLAAATADAAFLFATNESIPCVKCAYALYPIGAAAIQALCPREAFTRLTVQPASSPRAYDKLTCRKDWRNTTPCIALVLAPSAEQIADAKEEGVTFELTPIAKDAFVFFVPVTNPIESLTSEQVRGIYSGRIRTWRELGVDLDAKLVPYQRNKGSGSQSALERLMGDVPIMEPLKEDHLRGMGGIISEAADYRNRPGALGFSFRYYMEELVKEKNVKILKIDGVAPTVENIRSGAYPFVETAYAATTDERKGNVRRFIDFLVSPAGRKLVERTGYVASGDVCALETVDVKTGARAVVKSFARKIEAPNWTRDGRHLVYNSGGRLWRVPASGGEEEPVDTGFCTRCNNDHVLSFDGRYVAVSHDEKGWGQSQVYVIPLDGSAGPRLVTPNIRCYLHGWSPDGKTFVYCAMRDADPKGDVYSISSEGGEETRLTDAPGLDDGPEYSPDGRHIWFCSVRSGLMQIWRMKSDGTEQTQITDEKERNCWFPHVSPDGSLVAYIAYRKGDLKPGEHLAGKHVELRVMPAEGGEARTVAKLYGGQGTINVNSWSPDSRRIAFVSYVEANAEASPDSVK